MARMRIAPFLLLAVAGGCAGSASAPAEDSFRERLLGTIPADTRVVVPAVFSTDGRRAAWVEQRDGVCRAVSGEHKGRPLGSVC